MKSARNRRFVIWQTTQNTSGDDLSSDKRLKTSLRAICHLTNGSKRLWGRFVIWQTAQNVSAGKVTKVFSSQSSPQPLERVSFPSFPVQFLLVFLKVRRPPSEEMKAYPEQPSGSVMLLLTTKKFSTPNVETLKAFSREKWKNFINLGK